MRAAEHGLERGTRGSGGPHATFGLRIPAGVDGVSPDLLDPRRAWKGLEPYDDAATRLRDMFRSNFDENRFRNFGIRPVM